MWAVLLLAVIPHQNLTVDGVERLELNNFYDLEGRLVFTQLVGWESDNHCRFWMMAKDQVHISRDRLRGDWTATWVDTHKPRMIRANSFSETWTQVDVELEDRAYFPTERRRPLK